MNTMPHREEVVIRTILEKHAAERPEKDCFIFEDGERWTYADTLQRAYVAANQLAECGVTRGDHVLVFLPNGKHFIRALLGISTLGAVIVPVNTAYKGETLRHVCENSGARVLITVSELSERIDGIGSDLKLVDAKELEEGPADAVSLDPPLEPWDIYLLLYTSGTTGPSKGVLMPYMHIMFLQYHAWTRLAGDDTALVDMPLFHNAALSLVGAMLRLGGSAVITKVFSASRYWDITKKFNVTYALIFSAMPNYLLSRPPQPDDAENPVRVVICAPMVKDPEGFKQRFGIDDLYSAYAMTETCVVFQTKGPIPNATTCGKVVDGVQVRIVDEHDIPVPIGTPGELILRTDLPWQMNAGYWKLPEETAKSWENGWFHTGDMFVCDDQGYYYFVDRKKDAIRRRGENISSFEVERDVMAYPEVKEAAAIAVPGEFADDEVKVFVVVKDEGRFDPAQLIEFLIRRMPYFMVPRFIEVVSELPKTETMRTKKHMLRKIGNNDATWDREAAGIVVSRAS